MMQTVAIQRINHKHTSMKSTLKAEPLKVNNSSQYTVMEPLEDGWEVPPNLLGRNSNFIGNYIECLIALTARKHNLTNSIFNINDVWDTN